VALGGGKGFTEMSHTLFFVLKTLLLMVWVVKIFVTKKDEASKDTFRVKK
jgi:hypothetical protein